MINKIFRLLLVIFIGTSISCKSQRNIQNEHVIARISDDIDIKFIIDTIEYKKEVSKRIYSQKNKVEYDKINVKYQNINGSKLYYLILYDFDNNLKTARVLFKIKNTLFFKKQTAFEQIYLSCIGGNNCIPTIHYENSKLFWTCSDKIKECSINQKSKCTIYRSVLTP